MTISNIVDVQARTFAALFDTREAAHRAVEDLVEAGIPREHISVRGEAAAGHATPSAGDDKGFWESLKDMFIPDEDKYAYAEGLRRGGHLVSVRADEANYNRVVDILDREGSVDMDAREATWRSEGWAGYTASTASGAARLAGTETGLHKVSATNGSAAPRLATGIDGAGARADAGRDDVMSLYEEQVQIGKRDVSHGRVRLRSYVVETPISEQVDLRSQSVKVERHAVDRPVAVGEAVFQDRVIEAEERAEEAVMSKTARVVEEISLRKTAQSETRTVSDSVRRTEVEVEDERSGHAMAKIVEPVPSLIPERKI